MSNYYELLNVDARATTYDIKKAFRQRAKELHPDANPTGGPELRQQFAELAEAYEVRRKAQHVNSRSAMTVLRIILRAMLRSCKVGHNMHGHADLASASLPRVHECKLVCTNAAGVAGHQQEGAV